MGAEVEIPTNFGLVGIVAALAALQHLWMWYEVHHSKRKVKGKASMSPLPTSEEGPKDGFEEAREFDAKVTAKQNCMESLSIFFTLLILGGIQHPRLSAFLGLLYIATRFLYWFGHTSGDAAKTTSLHTQAWVVVLLFMCATTLSFGIQSMFFYKD